MDQCMIDVSDVHNINIGDEVTVFGDGLITADNVAEWMNTINYEVLCLVSKRIPRIYKEKGREVFTVNYLDEI
jgi:alanine racemase